MPSLHHRYVPYEQLSGVPNVIVDGYGNDATVLELSHWPGHRTPRALQRDLSAEVAFAYLDHPELHQPGLPVSNNHFDEDGAIAMFALVDPDAALARRARAIEVARVGDFAVTDDLDAARASFAIHGAIGGYENLDRLPALLDHPGRFEPHWRAEWDAFAATEADIAARRVHVEAVADLDLTIVHVGADAAPPHPLAVNRASNRGRVLTVADHAYTFTYRYPTWLQLVERPFAPRVDLTPLAARLTREETGGARWRFDGLGGIAPSLKLEDGGSSTLDETTVRRALAAALEG